MTKQQRLLEQLVDRLHFTDEQVKQVGGMIGIDFTKIDFEQFKMGMDVELEHGTKYPQANITNDDPVATGKIALAHILEIPDYYTRLRKMELEASE